MWLGNPEAMREIMLRAGRRYWRMLEPPSTLITWPVM
jgi:hypothetical protein